MDSDKFGTLVQLRDFTSKLIKSDDQTFTSLLLPEFTKIIGAEMMHKIIYKGLYEYYPLLQSEQMYNLMAVTLKHCKQTNQNEDRDRGRDRENEYKSPQNSIKQTQDIYEYEENIDISDISDPFERDIKSNLINIVIPSLSTQTLEILLQNRDINIASNDNRNKPSKNTEIDPSPNHTANNGYDAEQQIITKQRHSALISLLSSSIKSQPIQSIRHYSTYQHLTKPKQLTAEYELFQATLPPLPSSDVNNGHSQQLIHNANDDEDLDISRPIATANNNFVYVKLLKDELFKYLNDILLPTNLKSLNSELISNICTYLDIQSLLRFEMCSRMICCDARKPSSCVAFDTSPASPLNVSQFAFSHYLATRYPRFCSLGIVPDIHRFTHTKEWNITLQKGSHSYNKYQFDPRSQTGSRYIHAVMRQFHGTPFQKRLTKLSVNLDHIQFDPDVPFPFHDNLETVNFTKINVYDILRLLSNYPSFKFENINFNELVLCNFENASDQRNFENFYRFLHILLPKWNKYYPFHDNLKYYPQELLSKFASLIDKPPTGRNLKFESIFDGELTTKKPEFGQEVAAIFNHPNVLKNCIETTVRGYVCHTKSTDDILQYFTLSILKNTGHILQSLHYQSDQFNLDFYGYNVYTNKILLSFPNLLELCLLFKDESIIPFIDIASMKKLKRVHFKINTLEFCENKVKTNRFNTENQNQSLLTQFLSVLMYSCHQLSFLRLHITVNPNQYYHSPSPFNEGFHAMFNNTNTFMNINNNNDAATNPNFKKLLNFFKMLQRTTNNAAEKQSFTLKLSINVEDCKLHITEDMAKYIKLILNDLYTKCKECVFLLKLQFALKECNYERQGRMYTINTTNNGRNNKYQQYSYNPTIILDQFLANDEDIKSQNWLIFKEMYISSVQKNHKNSFVWAFVNNSNCSINGYSPKWSCDCCVCNDKIPWFWKGDHVH